jgi:hypothetical protein
LVFFLFLSVHLLWGRTVYRETGRKKKRGGERGKGAANIQSLD